MKEIRGYKINTKLFWIPIIIVLPLFLFVIYQQGVDVLRPTVVYECHNMSFGDCKFLRDNITLNPGEKLVFNDNNNPLIPLVNNLVWLLILGIAAINHLIYNRDYKINKKKFDEIRNKGFE